jgi:formate hydrogenlyase subunit 6/NADH:ubiquinone oxidoreductase subunit I
VLKHSGSMSPSAYRVETLPQTCTGCGRCAKRCPMGILELRPHRLAKNKLGTASTLTSDHCIGCGVCARGCPSGSLRLVRRDHTIEPPVDVADLKQRYAREVAAGSTADVSSGEPGS